MKSAESISRSEFLRGGLKSLFKFTAEVLDDKVEAKTQKMFIPLLRPPGAIDELSFLTKCTRCDLCMDACPHDAIVKAGTKHGMAVETPMIKPADAPCYLCADTPCISACPEETLVPVEKIKIGTAYVVQNKCFACNGQVDMCDYCFERCPLKGQAIVMENRQPRVIAEACTGCGICEFFCPAPGNAIRVLPERI